MGKVKAVPQFSESISSFCELMENAQRDYAWNYDEVNRMDRLTQDYLTDISVDDETAAAIQKKVTAQQELELANIEKQTAKVQAEKDREVAQINAEKAVIEAEAKAETLRIAAEAEADANRKIAASLTNELIEKIKYEQWNGELPTVTGSTPIISLEP